MENAEERKKMKKIEKEEQLKKHSASVETVPKYNKKQKEDLIDWLKNNL